jgi:hypothetical protein
MPKAAPHQGPWVFFQFHCIFNDLGTGSALPWGIGSNLSLCREETLYFFSVFLFLTHTDLTHMGETPTGLLDVVELRAPRP